MPTLTETFRNIAAAIRGRTGKTATMTPAEMVTEISKLSDTSADTVTAAKMLSGTTAHDKSGAKVTGTIATKTASDITASGATVSFPAGHYASAQSKSVATATQATPSISVNSAGKITASATQSAGYVSAGTKSATKQLTVQAAQTITPGTTDKTIASGRYLTGTQTIKGDANLVPENIASGVTIFGVEGSLEAGTGGGGEGGGDGPDAYFAVNPDLRAESIELIPFKAGMTWLDFYDSSLNGVLLCNRTGNMDMKITDADGIPAYSFFFEGDMTRAKIESPDGGNVAWEDTIQAVDLETFEPVYIAQ